MLEKFEIFDSKYADECISLRCTQQIKKYNLSFGDILFLKITTNTNGMIVYEYNNEFYIDEVDNFDNLYKIIEIRRKKGYNY